MSGSHVDPREPYRVYDVDDFLSRAEHPESDPWVGPDFAASAPGSIERSSVRARSGRRVVPLLFAAVVAALVVAIKLASLHASPVPNWSGRQKAVGRRAAGRSAPTEPTPLVRRHRRSRHVAARSHKQARAIPETVLPATAGSAAPAPAEPSNPSQEFGFER